MTEKPNEARSAEWRRLETSPDRTIDRLLPTIPRGPLCYIGPLAPDRARRLGRAGFDVEIAVLADGPVIEWRPSTDLDVAEREVGRRGSGLPDLRYTFMVLDGVLAWMSPPHGDGLLASVRRATRPGGVVIASALAIDDPAYEALKPAEAAATRRAVRLADGAWLRFHMPGELTMAFAGWTVLHSADETARDDRGRERRLSVVAARRPPRGSLLA